MGGEPQVLPTGAVSTRSCRRWNGMCLRDRGPFRRASLKRYLSMMSTAQPIGLVDPFVAQILEQQGFAIEDDPRSVYEPAQLYDALQRYATDTRCFDSLDAHLEYGFRKAFKIFAKPKNMRPFHVLSDVEVMTKALKLDRSAGLPLMVSKADSLTYSFDRERQVRAGAKAPNPCVAYKRTQRGNKTRLVWGYPLEMTIMEARFARPLIDWFVSHRSPMAFGMKKGVLGANLHRYFEDSFGTTVCLDYSKYDTTITRTMILESFRILATWFEEQDLQTFGWPIVRNYFIFTPIVMPDGHLYTGKNHGVPSGSYFTQLIDSVVNTALMYALSHKFGFFFKDRALFVLGDDSIVQVQGKVDVSAWRRYLGGKFGMILHDDEKTIVGHVHFLGATWIKGKPDAPIQELVNKAAQPEAWRRYDHDEDQGAKQVLRSYASGYLAAWRFIPAATGINFRCVDQPLGADWTDVRFMTGSDRLFAEEQRLAGLFDKGPTPSLAERILL